MNKLSVLVTRPDPGGAELCDLLLAQNDLAIHFPTLVFNPPPDMGVFNGAINALGDQDWLIFISPQAVRASIPAVRRAWPQFSDQTKFAAVGLGTARALKEAGWLVSCIPDTESSSDGLLEMPEFQSVAGKKIAIIRGVGGRERLEPALLARGAEVISVIAYERALPDRSSLPALPHKIDVMIGTSGQGIRNLKQLLGENEWQLIKQTPLIVISERLKALAHDLGFQTIWVAANASHEAILALLAQKRNDL